ncbi:hypothetical protein [Microbulbifer sp. VAAF005]|uniref:hypothetical protein n=1 Tax=Microbulbifer sp. VAAF005 TaxID=3034230 RepID=UPI0024AE3AFB|nr:hypothetical protein [Microbulbifer sp. VAAF005]WHI48524.1 hypothetical protein P0078_09165 [Microbulbifer sp. VAAF005]
MQNHELCALVHSLLRSPLEIISRRGTYGAINFEYGYMGKGPFLGGTFAHKKAEQQRQGNQAAKEQNGRILLRHASIPDATSGSTLIFGY